jgi:hypothetical protein
MKETAESLVDQHDFRLEPLCTLADKVMHMTPLLEGERLKHHRRRGTMIFRAIGKVLLLHAPDPEIIERFRELKRAAHPDRQGQWDQAVINELAEIERTVGAEWLGIREDWSKCETPALPEDETPWWPTEEDDEGEEWKQSKQ